MALLSVVLLVVWPAMGLLQISFAASSWWGKRVGVRLHVAVSREGLRFSGGRRVPWSCITLAERRGRGRFRDVRMETTQPAGSVLINVGMLADPRGLLKAVSANAGQ